MPVPISAHNLLLVGASVLELTGLAGFQASLTPQIIDCYHCRVAEHPVNARNRLYQLRLLVHHVLKLGLG